MPYQTTWIPYHTYTKCDFIQAIGPPWPPRQGGAGQSILLINEEAMTQISAHRDWCLAKVVAPSQIWHPEMSDQKCQQKQKEKVVLYTVYYNQKSKGELFSKCFPNMFEELPVLELYMGCWVWETVHVRWASLLCSIVMSWEWNDRVKSTANDGEIMEISDLHGFSPGSFMGNDPIWK